MRPEVIATQDYRSSRDNANWLSGSEMPALFAVNTTGNIAAGNAGASQFPQHGA